MTSTMSTWHSNQLSYAPRNLAAAPPASVRRVDRRPLGVPTAFPVLLLFQYAREDSNPQPPDP